MVLDDNRDDCPLEFCEKITLKIKEKKIFNEIFFENSQNLN